MNSSIRRCICPQFIDGSEKNRRRIQRRVVVETIRDSLDHDTSLCQYSRVFVTLKRDNCERALRIVILHVVRQADLEIEEPRYRA
jgi:hypothetical protein